MCVNDLFCTVLTAFLPGFLVLVATNNEGPDHKFTFFPGVSLSGARFAGFFVVWLDFL